MSHLDPPISFLLPLITVDYRPFPSVLTRLDGENILRWCTTVNALVDLQFYLARPQPARRLRTGNLRVPVQCVRSETARDTAQQSQQTKRSVAQNPNPFALRLVPVPATNPERNIHGQHV